MLSGHHKIVFAIAVTQNPLQCMMNAKLSKGFDPGVSTGSVDFNTTYMFVSSLLPVFMTGSNL